MGKILKSMIGLVVKALSGFYYVESGNVVYECKARGRFRSIGESPLVGDKVEFTPNGEKGVIDRIYDRKNYLIRPPVANIDKLFIISSASTPSPNFLLIDKMTVLCEYNGIEPIIVFNKCDLSDLSDYVNKYKKVGYKAIECSSISGQGIDEIKMELKNSVTAFTGNSGVGKSSILNVVFPKLNLSTGEVSDKLGRGRHTTRHTELFANEYGGYVADTPGFSAIEYTIQDMSFIENLDEFFPEFSEYKSNCKFTDCRHIGEKGCAICSAAEDSFICSERLTSYQTIYNEIKSIKPWELKKN